MKKKDDSSGPDEASFAQEYDPAAGAVVELHIYCRMCRRMFSVSFAPKPSARLRCPCGYEASLAELDVFKSEARAKDFSTLYEKLYNAAKEALRAANIKLPPSQKLPAIRDGAVVESDIASPQEGNLEDLSDIASAYVGGAKDVRGAGAAAREKKLRDAIGRASGILERHEAFSQLIEHLYCIRHREPGALERFQQACRQDIVIANDVIAEAKRRRAAGRPARVAFTSFKHLAIALEEQGDVAGALEVVLGAIGIGLPGYDERAAELRASLKAAARASSGEKKGPRKSGAHERPLAKKSPATGRSLGKGSGSRPPLAPPQVKGASSDAVIPSSHDLEAFDDLVDL